MRPEEISRQSAWECPFGSDFGHILKKFCELFELHGGSLDDNVRITEKHYSAWVRERQEQLESELQRAWNEDPIVQVAKKQVRRLGLARTACAHLDVQHK